MIRIVASLTRLFKSINRDPNHKNETINANYLFYLTLCLYVICWCTVNGAVFLNYASLQWGLVLFNACCALAVRDFFMTCCRKRYFFNFRLILMPDKCKMQHQVIFCLYLRTIIHANTRNLVHALLELLQNHGALFASYAPEWRVVEASTAIGVLIAYRRLI